MERERDDETSQLWILRHLRLLLNNIDDSILSSFILHQDCTPLRNFVNGYGKRRALYILVKRTDTTGATSTLLPHTIAIDNQQKAWKAPAPTTIKKAMGKKLTTTKRKKKIAQNMNSAEIEPTNEEQVITEKSANALQDETPPLVTLSWCDTQLPAYSNEFVFIVTKTHASSNTRFDQIFHIGMCNKGNVYWRLIDLAIAIFGCEVDDYLKVDLLLLFSNAGFRWNDSSNKLRNFVIESIGLLHADSRKKEETDSISLPNMQTLLRPRIEASAHGSLDTTERCRLLMELSLFDVDFIEHSLDPKSAAQRFTFALSTLQVLHLLYANEHSHFIRKATLYCIETIAKIVAIHIKRKTLSILSGDNYTSIWNTMGSVAIEFFTFGTSIMAEGSDDFFNVERISKCFALMETLEKEIDRVYKFANNTMNERTDMNRERSALEKAAKIIQQIGEEFDEKGIISVAESGNADALKALIVAISTHFSTLTAIVGNHDPQIYKGISHYHL